MRLVSGTRLGSYQIVAPIGAGGMGEVYRARDHDLGRDVAVKVLPQSLADDPEALARFRLEARALAALSHPNIVSIHDLDSHEGVFYAVMELLEGETLRDKIGDGRPLPRGKAVEYAREIARGLAAAHEKGIVHRDLKPENVFVTSDERLKILDFGLAKRAEALCADETSAPTLSRVTEPGTVLGTVGYMAPEQVRGLSIDHRADIFALGAILYELLTGQRAFHGVTASDTMAAILRDEPTELCSGRSALGPALARTVKHCLEKNRDARAQSALDVAHELETAAGPPGTESVIRNAVSAVRSRSLSIGGVAAFAFVAAIVGAAAFRYWSAAAPAARFPAAISSSTRTAAKRLAVLPFENLGATADDYFADGITDEVRGKLTRIPGLEVIARTSSIAYRNATVTPQEIGKHLDAEYLLTGTVRFATDAAGIRRVQVSSELVVAPRAVSKWAQSFDAALTDVFGVQGEIATRVATALDVALSEESRNSLQEKPTRDLPAYEAYLRGEAATAAMLADDPQSLRRGIVEYERAVAQDPNFLGAWARLGSCLSMLYFNTAKTRALAERARNASERALALDPTRPEGHAALSTYYAYVPQDNRRSLAEAERARELAPGNAFLISVTAIAERNLGHWEESLAHLEEARRLDPRSAITLRRLGYVALWLRRTTKAREAFDAALSLAPGDMSLLEFRAMTNLQDGDLAGARQVLRTAHVEPSALVATISQYFSLAWMLDDTQRNVLVHLGPEAFDGDSGVWARVLMQALASSGDARRSRKYAEIASENALGQLEKTPDEPQALAGLAISLAYLGRKAEAIRQAQAAAKLVPDAEDAILGPFLRHQLVCVYVLTGEQEKAIDVLEQLMTVPYYLTKSWLRIDPTFDPLRENPRFARLVR